eukprot:Rmarinus@m.16974
MQLSFTESARRRARLSAKVVDAVLKRGLLKLMLDESIVALEQYSDTLDTGVGETSTLLHRASQSALLRVTFIVTRFGSFGDASFGVFGQGPRDAALLIRLQMEVTKWACKVWSHPGLVKCPASLVQALMGVISTLLQGVPNIRGAGSPKLRAPVLSSRFMTQRAVETPPEPDESLITTLVEMGFSRERSRDALRDHGAGTNIEEALEWLFANPEPSPPPAAADASTGDDVATTEAESSTVDTGTGAERSEPVDEPVSTAITRETVCDSDPVVEGTRAIDVADQDAVGNESDGSGSSEGDHAGSGDEALRLALAMSMENAEIPPSEPTAADTTQAVPREAGVNEVSMPVDSESSDDSSVHRDDMVDDLSHSSSEDGSDADEDDASDSSMPTWKNDAEQHKIEEISLSNHKKMLSEAFGGLPSKVLDLAGSIDNLAYSSCDLLREACVYHSGGVDALSNPVWIVRSVMERIRSENTDDQCRFRFLHVAAVFLDDITYKKEFSAAGLVPLLTSILSSLTSDTDLASKSLTSTLLCLYILAQPEVDSVSHGTDTSSILPTPTLGSLLESMTSSSRTPGSSEVENSKSEGDKPAPGPRKDAGKDVSAGLPSPRLWLAPDETQRIIGLCKIMLRRKLPSEADLTLIMLLNRLSRTHSVAEDLLPSLDDLLRRVSSPSLSSSYASHLEGIFRNIIEDDATLLVAMEGEIRALLSPTTGRRPLPELPDFTLLPRPMSPQTFFRMLAPIAGRSLPVFRTAVQNTCVLESGPRPNIVLSSEAKKRSVKHTPRNVEVVIVGLLRCALDLLPEAEAAPDVPEKILTSWAQILDMLVSFCRMYPNCPALVARHMISGESCVSVVLRRFVGLVFIDPTSRGIAPLSGVQNLKHRVFKMLMNLLCALCGRAGDTRKRVVHELSSCIKELVPLTPASCQTLDLRPIKSSMECVWELLACSGSARAYNARPSSFSGDLLRLMVEAGLASDIVSLMECIDPDRAGGRQVVALILRILNVLTQLAAMPPSPVQSIGAAAASSERVGVTSNAPGPTMEEETGADAAPTAAEPEAEVHSDDDHFHDNMAHGAYDDVVHMANGFRNADDHGRGTAEIIVDVLDPAHDEVMPDDADDDESNHDDGMDDDDDDDDDDVHDGVADGAGGRVVGPDALEGSEEDDDDIDDDGEDGEVPDGEEDGEVDSVDEDDEPINDNNLDDQAFPPLPSYIPIPEDLIPGGMGDGENHFFEPLGNLMENILNHAVDMGEEEDRIRGAFGAIPGEDEEDWVHVVRRRSRNRSRLQSVLPRRLLNTTLGPSGAGAAVSRYRLTHHPGGNSRSRLVTHPLLSRPIYSPLQPTEWSPIPPFIQIEGDSRVFRALDEVLEAISVQPTPRTSGNWNARASRMPDSAVERRWGPVSDDVPRQAEQLVLRDIPTREPSRASRQITTEGGTDNANAPATTEGTTGEVSTTAEEISNQHVGNEAMEHSSGPSATENVSSDLMADTGAAEDNPTSAEAAVASNTMGSASSLAVQEHGRTSPDENTGDENALAEVESLGAPIVDHNRCGTDIVAPARKTGEGDTHSATLSSTQPEPECGSTMAESQDTPSCDDAKAAEGASAGSSATGAPAENVADVSRESAAENAGAEAETPADAEVQGAGDDGIDQSFLDALPDDIRLEIMQNQARHLAAASGQPEPSLEQGQSSAAAVNPEFLAELPPEIVAELLGRDGPAAATAPPPGPEALDPATFIATLLPEYRQEAFLSFDDGMLAQLPPELFAEAHTARDRARHGPGRIEPRHTDRAGRPERSGAPRPTERPAKPDGVRVLSDRDIRTLLFVVCCTQDPNKSLFNRVINNICANAASASMIASTLVKLLRESRTNHFELPFYMKGEIHEAPARGVVIRQALDALMFLAKNSNRVCTALLDLGKDPEGTPVEKEASSSSSPHAPPAWNQLLDLLGEPVVTDSHPLANTLVQILCTLGSNIGDRLSAASSDADREPLQRLWLVGEQSLRHLVDLVGSQACSDSCFRRAVTLMKSFAGPEKSRTTLTAVLRSAILSLSGSVQKRLHEVEDVFENTSTDLAGIVLQCCTPSPEEIQFMRYILALHSVVEAHRPDDSTVTSLATILDSDSGLSSLWASLSNTLKRLNKRCPVGKIKAPLRPLLSRFLLVIEPFFLVHTPSLPDLKEPKPSDTHPEGPPRSLPPPRSLSQPSSRAGSPIQISGHDCTPLIKFIDENRRVLNAVMSLIPKLMNTSLKFMVKMRPSSLDFENKRAYFSSCLKKTRPSGGHVPVVRLHIRRDQVFEDSFRQLRHRTQDEIRGRLQVEFVGEEGIDAGGVSREWYQILSREIFNPNYALFKPSALNNHTFQPNECSHIEKEHLSYFRFVGRVIGKAIYDGQLFDAHFTRSFYKHMLNAPITVDDVEAIDEHFYNSLKWMLANDITDVLDLTFSAEIDEFGIKKVVDLKPGGRHLAVTEANKGEYVRLITDLRLTSSIRKQIDSFLEGFHELIPEEMLSIFNEKELELLISGLPEIDIDDLHANTEYTGYTLTSPQIQWFWQAVRKMNQDERARFVMFVTGTSKVPLEGFKALQGMHGPQKFNIHKAYGDENRLASAHTCFNQLDLPEYPSYEVLEERLMFSIREGAEGFGFG